ncbi:MAG: TraC family protein, partial [Rhodospirillales bacterium]|nr:TraC family protein [Rhodospirillales bacterium]
MIARLMDIFEGPDSMAPWTPPRCPEALHELLPWRAWDEGSELYINESSHGFALELPPFAGIDAETLGALAGVLADAAPERCTIQVIHWASPRFGAPLSAWATARRQPAARGQPAAPGRSGALPESAVHQHESAVRQPESAVRQHGLLSVMAERRERLFGHAGWSPLHPGGPPFTCADYRVFVTASLAGRPGPASETALGAFRRALEGTLASAGAHARRLQPDSLLSLAVELIAPAVGKSGATVNDALLRPERRWSPRDPLHNQCASPGRAMTVTPEGLAFHDPDGADVAVRVLTALAFPEVWPGWRGNALSGDFPRDFLQPGCPVLTCLIVMTGDTG